MAVRFQLRRDTAANWISTNPVLALGEPGVEIDTLKVKVGDGATAWTSLAYSITKDFTELTSKPTTIAGYGITDGLTLSGLSVTQTDGGTDLTYDNTTGEFTFTASAPAFHGFSYGVDGHLQYTKMTSGDIDVQNASNEELYDTYEISLSSYGYIVDASGHLVIQFGTA
jgi:hypothetical protein